MLICLPANTAPERLDTMPCLSPPQSALICFIDICESISIAKALAQASPAGLPVLLPVEGDGGVRTPAQACTRLKAVTVSIRVAGQLGTCSRTMRATLLRAC